MKPYLVYVRDINGNRVETVVDKTTKNGQDVLIFSGAGWAYRGDTREVTLDETHQAFGLLAEAVALMPLGTKKRADWVKKAIPLSPA